MGNARLDLCRTCEFLCGVRKIREERRCVIIERVSFASGAPIFSGMVVDSVSCVMDMPNKWLLRGKKNSLSLFAAR